jgi:hypothetical protein
MYDLEEKDNLMGIVCRKLVNLKTSVRHFFILLKSNGCYLARSTVCPVKQEDCKLYPKLRKKMQEFDEAISSDWFI